MKTRHLVSRREFMEIATWMIGGMISLVLGIPAIAYIVAPAWKREEIQDWIGLGSSSKVELGTPTLFSAGIERHTGWIKELEKLSVYVLTENGHDYIAMSNICTHLGCRVRWIADSEQFFCPCHNGIFDKDGKVISGPPPRPLDRYPIKVEDGQIFIKDG
jgi:Rieske Fe-S protein